jgi:hypothetical protein
VLKPLDDQRHEQDRLQLFPRVTTEPGTTVVNSRKPSPIPLQCEMHHRHPHHTAKTGSHTYRRKIEAHLCLHTGVLVIKVENRGNKSNEQGGKALLFLFRATLVGRQRASRKGSAQK